MSSLRDTSKGGDTAIVHVWKTSENIKPVLEKGYSVVVAPGDYLYLASGTSFSHPLLYIRLYSDTDMADMIGPR